MNKTVHICGKWERTPWLLRCWPFRKPDYRRTVCVVDEFRDCAWLWQYAGEDLPGFSGD